MTTRAHFIRFALLACLLSLASLSSVAEADSVAQIASAVRINRGTATLIDPQGRPTTGGGVGDTVIRAGDILTFTAAFTPVPNGGVRGLGGYVTVYIPRNTEVVSARFIDSMGRTISPHRGGLGEEAAGPRGNVNLTARTALPNTTTSMVGGTMSQLYADTGIFFSTDPRTTRAPDGSVATETFITLHNGLLMNPEPTAYGQLDGRLGSLDPYAHSEWDVIQAYAFGVGGSIAGNGGRGNTPDRYGSPVAGPDSFYLYEATIPGALALDIDNVVILTDPAMALGPWQRIQTLGAEIGRRGVVPPVMARGVATRIGVPALDGTGAPLGVRLDADNPLISFDSGTPSDPHTRALRFAVGELVVGEEYLSEFSLRVLATPLDPISGTDTVCAEVFGGDASSEGNKDGKDNAWRYFLPAPACVNLALLFDLDVSDLVTTSGETLTYTITARNLSTSPHTDVVVTHCYDGRVAFDTATAGFTMGSGGECAGDFIQWTIPRLEPGEERVYTLDFTAGGDGETTGRAVFTSTELPTPGFSTVAFTNIGALVLMDFAMTATPSLIETPPGRVHYTATLTNNGTGDADSGCGTCGATITIPSDFIFVDASATVTDSAGASAAAVPTGALPELIFDIPSIPSGGAITIEFDADVPSAHPAGIYASSIETWLDEGEQINDTAGGLADVVIGARSDTPGIDTPLINGTSMVCGTSAEATASVIRIYFGGIYAAEGTVGSGGTWCVTVPTLFPGLAVSATAEASGEHESERSAEATVSVVSGAACSDGIDNDGDGDIDFPADADCASPDDLDEASSAECSDGIDNDGDGDIDFGSDPGCSSLIDNTEAGAAACANGVDDDDDGLIDFPDDPGCSSADDVSERVLPQCADGMDNDSDTFIDYPLDRGCASAVDNDETAETSGGLDAGMAGTDGGSTDGGTPPGGDSGGSGDGGVPDPGGVERPADGCNCRAAGSSSGGAGFTWGLALLGLVAARRRR